MKEICKELLRRKYAPQPACTCNSCWDSWFIRNRGKYKAAKKAMEMFGENTVRLGQMRQMVKDILDMKQAIIETLPKSDKWPIGPARLTDADKKIVTIQVTRFLKQLKRFMVYEHKRFGELVA